jgi:hypothetical protein
MRHLRHRLSISTLIMVFLGMIEIDTISGTTPIERDAKAGCFPSQ